MITAIAPSHLTPIAGAGAEGGLALRRRLAGGGLRGFAWGAPCPPAGYGLDRRQQALGAAGELSILADRRKPTNILRRSLDEVLDIVGLGGGSYSGGSGTHIGIGVPVAEDWSSSWCLGISNVDMYGRS